MTVAGGAVLDLGGLNDTIASLNDDPVLGGGTVTNNGASPATLTITPPAPASMTFSGVLQDGASQLALTLNGPSLLILAGNNTYSGLTTINGGTLQIGNGGPNGSLGTGDVVDNGQLTLDVSGTTTVAGAISGNGSLLQMAGTAVLTGNNTYAGTTTINPGATLQVGNGGSTGSVGAGAVIDNGNLAFNLNGTTAVPGVGGSGSLTQMGPGTVVLYGNNTYGGATNVTGGTLALFNAAAHLIASYSLNIGSYTGPSTGGNLTSGNFADTSGNGHNLTVYSWGGTAQFTTGELGDTNGAVTFPYGGFNMYTPYLGEINTWTASAWIYNTTWKGYIYSGRENGGYGADIACLSGLVTVDIPNNAGGWIVAGDQNSIPINQNAWSMLTETVTQGEYQIYLNGVLVVSEAMDPGQTPELMPAGNVFGLGVGDFGGGLCNFNLYNTVLTAGEIQALYAGTLASGNLPAGSPLTVASGAAFDMGGVSTTVATVSGAGTITNSAGVATLTFAPTSPGTATFSGVIQDGAGQTAVTFDGPGSTQVLTGFNTYSGLTTITAGTLQIGDGGADGAINGTLGIVNNGVLEFNSSLTTTCPAAISGSGTLVQAGVGGALILTGSSNYTGPTIVSAGTLGFGVLASAPAPSSTSTAAAAPWAPSSPASTTSAATATTPPWPIGTEARASTSPPRSPRTPMSPA